MGHPYHRPVFTHGFTRRLCAVLLLSLALAGCHERHARTAPVGLLATAASSTPPPMAITLAAQINQANFLRDVRVLASPALGGRKPGTRGEVLTTHYLIAQFQRMRLLPGYRGTWLQPVPVVSTRLRNTSTQLRVRLGGAVQTFAYGTDFIATTQQARARVALRHVPIVFVGYGIDAPSRPWNDYEGLDVRGKMVIVLANDPGEAAAADSGAASLSHHGLARVKFALAARLGAAGCLIIHAGASSGYTWDALRNASAGAVQALPQSASPGPRLAVAGWLRHAAAERLFGAAGLNLDALAAAAAQPRFKPVTLPASASLRLESSVTYGWSDNVLALIRGAVHPHEVVIYSAHWDGLGILPAPRGAGALLPGAIDNASGVAALLEIADSFAHRKSPPARSVLFLLPTLGEAGQLGSRYYVEHPVFPLDHTVADINIDFWPLLGRARDMAVYGEAHSGLTAALQRLLAVQGRTLSPDPPPAVGLFYRSDQYSFARAGVPAILAGPGLDLVSGGRTAGEAHWRDDLLERVKTPEDAYNPHWDLSGTLEDIQTLYLLGRALADSTQWPDWGPQSRYRARRDAMMARIPGALGPSAPVTPSASPP